MKKIFLISGLILMSVFFMTLIASQEAMYCAERTTYGASCQNVPLSEVNTNYRYDRTSCAATSYCSSGTCVNTLTGECLPSTSTACDPEQGGFFYSLPKDEVAQCQVGCCLLGDGAALIERVRCDTLGKDYNVQATFRGDIQDELMCLALASPEAKGACVFETDRGRDCRTITRGECQSSAGEFHEGFLCTAPELGTICARTQRTTCVEGKNEVYYMDSCGNIANIYDANKVDDIAYWSYVPGVEGVEVSVGDGRGNRGSAIYGYCDYLMGSTCKKYTRSIDSVAPRYGDYICRDLGCPARDLLTSGRYRDHGEEWCSEPISNFENAKPGQLSYLLYCYDGEVHYELCDSFRNKLCYQNTTTGAAGCIVNQWMQCIEQNSTKDCKEIGDCKVVTGANVLRTAYGTEKLLRDSETGKDIIAACVPKYTPGFKFWDPSATILDGSTEGTPISICNFASIVCFVPYTQEVAYITTWRAGASDECVAACKEIESWSSAKCYEACTPVCFDDTLGSKNANATINASWATSWQNLCVSLGDCGISSNYLGGEGYNKWKDLFLGDKIDWTTLPNADSKR